MEFFKNFDYNIIRSDSFKEDSVREEIITPILKALGFSSFGDNKIIRSQNLKHPYIYFGTRKENIYIIPDYLLQVNDQNKVVIDAKSPKEIITKGKNVEQAYSYAIHQEIKAKFYALCNGIEFIVFDIDKILPIFYCKIEDLESKWVEFNKILSPLGLSHPNVLNYHPDYGIRLLKAGIPKDIKHYFYGAWVESLIKLNDDTYTINSSTRYDGGDFFISFDFDKKLLNDFLNQVPKEKVEEVLTSITYYPFSIHYTEDPSFEVAIECELSDTIIEVEYEYFCPFIVTRFIKI